MQNLNEFLEFYEKNKIKIKEYLESFQKIREDKEVFGEIVFCLCTPQSKAKYCREFVEAIKTENSIFSLNLNQLRERMDRIRFFERKSEFIVEARNQYPEIKSSLINNRPELRTWLVENVRGLGMKESAHLLRNLGHKGLPIIDVHVQRFLRKLGLYESEKKNMTKKQYIELEKKFLDLSNKLRIPPEELDIAIWLYESGEKNFYG